MSRTRRESRWRWAILIAALSAILLILAVLPDYHSRYAVADGKLIKGDCTREFIIGKAQFARADALKRVLAEGKIERWRDLSFQDAASNEGPYIAYPDARRNAKGARIELIDVYLHGEKVIGMRMPVLQLEHSGISIAAPQRRYVSCLELQKTDFIDYL